MDGREPADDANAPDAPDTGAPGTTATATRPPEGPYVVSPSVYKRLMSGLPGFCMALVASLALVGVVILITPRHNESAMPHADYSSDLAGLTAVAPYQVLAPQGLPQRWFATSTRLSGHGRGPISWHLGFSTPSKEYAALEESNETPDGAGHFIDRMTSQGHPDGTSQIAGATWDRRFRPDKKQRSLIHRFPGVTIILTGTASYEELGVLAAALKPQPKPSSAATPVG
ncbi:hypothetical protein GCM10023191_010070 [Actinoallomurus oryzae]|uniref:DUF4245 domain-containing protein n=1 Tax=Actinoallomurus oryzae TaxID=502180 RepID=A0ABP8PEV1_9ACTN